MSVSYIKNLRRFGLKVGDLDAGALSFAGLLSEASAVKLLLEICSVFIFGSLSCTVLIYQRRVRIVVVITAFVALLFFLCFKYTCKHGN